MEDDKPWAEEGEVLVVELYHYENRGVGVEVYDHKAEELYYKINVKEDEEPSRVETYTAYPYGHTDARTKETQKHTSIDLKTLSGQQAGKKEY